MFQAGHNDGECRGARTELEKGNGWRNMQHSSLPCPERPETTSKRGSIYIESKVFHRLAPQIYRGVFAVDFIENTRKPFRIGILGPTCRSQ